MEKRRVGKYAYRADRRISVTAGGFHEPALLLEEAGGGLGGAGRDGVVGGTAEQGNGVLGIEGTQFLAAQLLHDLAGFLPGLDPAAALGDLLGGPIGQARAGFRGYGIWIHFCRCIGGS